MFQRHKILHIITRWMKSGGAERNTYFTIKALKKEGYNVDLIIGGDSETIPEDLGIKVIRLNTLKRNINPIFDIIALYQIYRIIRRERYCLVHTHQSKAGVLGRLAAKLARVPVVIHTIHGPSFYPEQDFFARKICVLIERFSAFYTDWFISVGEELKDYYLKNKIGNPQNFSVIRSGIPLERFFKAKSLSFEEKIEIKKNLGVGSQDSIVGMVGALEPRKGYQYAIEVAKEVVRKHPNTKFLFVGCGPLRSFLERKAQKLNLANSIIFTGHREDIERIMAVFDVFIFTSLGKGEGLPQVLVQAAVLEKPIVSFDVLGAKEVVKENGFLVPIKDTKAIIEKLDYLLSDLKRAKGIGKRSVNYSFKEWGVKEVTKKTIALYEDLLFRKNKKVGSV